MTKCSTRESISRAALDVVPAVMYPTDPRDVLLSGWISGEERLTGRAAAVATTYGKGKIVLLGSRAQNRGQTHATFPFVFNSLYWSVQ